MDFLLYTNTLNKASNIQKQKLIKEKQNLKNIKEHNDRKVLPITNVYIMDNVKIPTVIVECGFLSNPEETENLKKDEYQNKLVWGIYLGIQDYFYNEVNKSE